VVRKARYVLNAFRHAIEADGRLTQSGDVATLERSRESFSEVDRRFSVPGRGTTEEVTAVTITTDVEVDALRQVAGDAGHNETLLNERHGLLRVVNGEELRTVDGNKHHDLRGNQGRGKTQLASIRANVRDTNRAHK